MKTDFFKLFVPKDSERFFLRENSRVKIKSGLRVHCVRGGIIATNTKTHAYGVLNSHGRFVRASRCLRHRTGQYHPHVKSVKDVEYCDCDAVFLGNGVRHFGHFLFEGMNRAYPALNKKYKNAKFVFVSNNGDEIQACGKTFLHALGVPAENIMVLTAPMRFRNVYVPEQAFNIPVWSSKEFADTYAKISDFYVKDRGKYYDKIYVSRCALAQRATFGEKQIEKIFVKNGFKVIYPETLSLERQIALMAHCRVLAGAAGTALHLALFMRPGGTVIQIKRNQVVQDNITTQNMLCRGHKLKLIYVAGSIEAQPTPHYTDCPQILGITEYMKHFFDDFKLKYNANDIAFDDAEYKKYMNALQEYKRTHGTSRSIKIRRKIVKIASCFVPGRIIRNRFRRWLKGVLKIE